MLPGSLFCLLFFLVLTGAYAAIRDCLKYMLPPNWVMSKDQIDALDTKGLQYFPLEQFLEYYKAQMDEYVKSRTEDAELRVQETLAKLETARAQQSVLRDQVAEIKATMARDQNGAQSRRKVDTEQVPVAADDAAES